MPTHIKQGLCHAAVRKLDFGLISVCVCLGLCRGEGVDEYLWVTCHNDPKFSDRQVWSNSVNKDQKEAV